MMIKLCLEGDLKDLWTGIEIMSRELGFVTCREGIMVKVVQRPGNIEAGYKDGTGYIKYHKKIHFFRALGLFLESARGKDYFKIYEEPQFTLNGVMADVSRNAVLTVESIKKLLWMMSLMGLNLIMLYTEDTYEIEGYPYFGYMRSRYSYDELKECDDYADIFGIEIIPCIQTLAHFILNT